MSVEVVHNLLSREFLLAHLAAHVTILLMAFRMDPAVRNLIEHLSAAGKRALKRLLICMDPEVVKEIVPLLEELPTACVVARKNLGPSCCGSTCVGD